VSALGQERSSLQRSNFPLFRYPTTSSAVESFEIRSNFFDHDKVADVAFQAHLF
jgi:hypothetical protein